MGMSSVNARGQKPRRREAHCDHLHLPLACDWLKHELLLAALGLNLSGTPPLKMLNFLSTILPVDSLHLRDLMRGYK